METFEISQVDIIYIMTRLIKMNPCCRRMIIITLYQINQEYLQSLNTLIIAITDSPYQLFAQTTQEI